MILGVSNLIGNGVDHLEFCESLNEFSLLKLMKC